MAPATVKWIGSSGSWDDPANWVDTTTKTNRVPGGGDDAVISDGAAVTVPLGGPGAVAASLTSSSPIAVDNNSLTLGGDSIIYNTLDMNNSSFNGTATLTVTGLVTSMGSSFGAPLIAAGGMKIFGGLSASGGVRTNGADWYSGNINGFITNFAGHAFNAEANNGGIGGTFLNEGTFLMSGGISSVTISGTFNSTASGGIFVLAGTLFVAGGSRNGTPDSIAGILNVGTGATLNLSGGTAIAAGTLVSGTGNFVLSGGELTLLGDVTLPNFTMGDPSLASSYGLFSGPTLDGPGNLTVAGMLTCNGGTMSGTGRTIANGGLVIEVDLRLDGRILNNAASGIWTSSRGEIRLDNGAVFNNLPGATFNASNGGFSSETGGTFANAGTFIASGLSLVGMPANVAFNNTGTVQIAGGTFETFGGSLNGGTYFVAPGAIWDIIVPPPGSNPAGFNLSGTLTGSGGGLVQLFDTTFAVADTGATLNFASGMLQVQRFQTGVIVTGGPLTNAGEIDLADAGNASATMTIAGNYIQTAAGSLNLTIGAFFADPITGYVTTRGQLAVGGSVALAGTLNVSPENGYQPQAGQSFQVLTFGSKTGDFGAYSGLALGNSLKLVPSYQPATNPTNLTLTVVPVMAPTTTAVTASANPSISGETVLFTATVTSGGNPVTSGTVTFQEGGTILASGVSLTASGQASFSLSSLTAGVHAITAYFSGNALFLASSGSLSQTVLSYSQATTNLVNQVNTANIPPGIQNDLLSTLQAAIDSFNRGNNTSGVNQLQAFENKVSAQRGKQIDAALADALIGDAQRIINAIG